jgi:hypothetical protein
MPTEETPEAAIELHLNAVRDPMKRAGQAQNVATK